MEPVDISGRTDFDVEVAKIAAPLVNEQRANERGWEKEMISAVEKARFLIFTAKKYREMIKEK